MCWVTRWYRIYRNGIFKIKGYEGIVGNYTSQVALSKRKNETFEKEVFRCFPYDATFNWNIKTFGPLYIPKAGNSIHMNQSNYILYKKYIEWEQQKELNIRGNNIFLGEESINTYQFSKIITLWQEITGKTLKIPAIGDFYPRNIS